MADLIPFPQPATTLNRHERRAREARGHAAARVLSVVRDLTDAKMEIVRRLSERARQGDDNAASDFARYAEEVCALIELEHEIASGRSGRRLTLKTLKRRLPIRTD